MRFSLKRQLLLASLLMLLIPWAGLQFVLELEEALRDQALTQLENQARRMQKAVAPALPATRLAVGDQPVLYATTLDAPLNVDGYDDDWPGYDSSETGDPIEPAGESLHWQAAVHEDTLYLLVRVNQAQPVYFDPGDPEKRHEHLKLGWQNGDTRQQQTLRTPAPGNVTGQPEGRPGRDEKSVRGVWQGTSRGYQLELRLPMPAEAPQLGFTLYRPTDDGDGYRVIAGPGGHLGMARLVSRQPVLEARLADFLMAGQQASLLESDGWVTAHSQLDGTATRPEFDSLSAGQIVEQISLNLLRALVGYFQPEATRLPEAPSRLDPAELPESGLVRFGDSSPHLVLSHPLGDGHTLILGQSLERILALSGNTLGTVIARSSLLILTLMLGLLGYASWLSWRITRLQRAIAGSVDEDGRLQGTPALPRFRASDELGELSRQFAQMVGRLQGYTDYLEKFSRRLSHELKTPVAVVRSSLDNLSHSDTPEERASYIGRARDATDRLSQILQGMSEASRLEQSFDQAEKETFDLADVAAQASAAYQTLDPDHRIVYAGPEHGCRVHGSPELMVQLLDKLVDNARDFTPSGGLIEIRLQSQSGRLLLSVLNQGPALPDTLVSDLFSPFVSLREGSQDGHLGQGLLIVQLISDYHGGRVTAANDSLGGKAAVRFSLSVPGEES